MLCSEDNHMLVNSFTEEHIRPTIHNPYEDIVEAEKFTGFSHEPKSHLVCSGASLTGSYVESAHNSATEFNRQIDENSSSFEKIEHIVNFKETAQQQHERKRKHHFTQKIPNQSSTWNQSPKSRAYINLDIRINSYVGFKSACKWPTFMFAKSGFFYKGFGDIVMCYHCGLVHKNWQADDDPILLHIQLSHDCGYIVELRNTGIVTCNDLTENEYNSLQILSFLGSHGCGNERSKRFSKRFCDITMRP